MGGGLWDPPWANCIANIGLIYRRIVKRNLSSSPSHSSCKLYRIMLYARVPWISKALAILQMMRLVLRLLRHSTQRRRSRHRSVHDHGRHSGRHSSCLKSSRRLGARLMGTALEEKRKNARIGKD